MLDTGVNAVGVERRERPQGYLEKCEQACSRKQVLMLKEWGGLRVEKRKGFPVLTTMASLLRARPSGVHSFSSYGTSMRGGHSYLHFT